MAEVLGDQISARWEYNSVAQCIGSAQYPGALPLVAACLNLNDYR